MAKDRHGKAPAALGETAGYLVLRGGEFSVPSRLGLDEMSRAADVGAGEADHTAVIVAAVEYEPGEYATSALAKKLADDYGDASQGSLRPRRRCWSRTARSCDWRGSGTSNHDRLLFIRLFTADCSRSEQS